MAYTKWKGRIQNDLRNRIRTRIPEQIILDPQHTATAQYNFRSSFVEVLN
jgi:hypothetical protein